MFRQANRHYRLHRYSPGALDRAVATYRNEREHDASVGETFADQMGAVDYHVEQFVCSDDYSDRIDPDDADSLREQFVDVLHDLHKGCTCDRGAV